MINFRKQQFPHIFLPFQLQLVSDSMPGKPKVLESLHASSGKDFSDDRFYKMSRVESSNYSVSIICKKTKLRLEAITCSGSHSLVLHFSSISDLLISMTIPALSRNSHADVESRRPQYILV